MITKNWPLTVDFEKGVSYRPMKFVAGDSGSCSITFTMIQDIEDGLRVFVTFVMSDGTNYIQEATVTDANTAVLELPSGVLSVAGQVTCQVAVHDDSGRLTNAVGFYYTVAEDLAEGAIEASDQYPILTQLIIDCEAIEDAEALRAIAEGEADPRSGRVGAELDRVDAEAARVISEGDETSGRVKAELDRVAAEGKASPKSGRVGAELDRVAAEEARAAAEGAASPKSGRVGAELDRVDAELARVAAEGDATKGRVKAENDRAAAEEARVLAEGDATGGRVKAENDRATAESARAVFEAYNAGKSYVVGNKVAYNGSSYTCIQDGTGKTPSSETAYWLLIASGGTGTSVITGYEEAAANAPIADTDTINEAFGKAQKQISDTADLVSTNSQSISQLEDLTKVYTDAQDLVPVVTGKSYNKYGITTGIGYGGAIGNPKNFDTLVFKIKPLSTNTGNVTAIKCIITVGDKTGEVICAKTIGGLAIVPNEEREIYFDLGEIVENSDGEQLYAGFICDNFINPYAGDTAGLLIPPNYAKTTYIATTATTPPFNINKELSTFTNIYDPSGINKMKPVLYVCRKKSMAEIETDVVEIKSGARLYPAAGSFSSSAGDLSDLIIDVKKNTNMFYTATFDEFTSLTFGYKMQSGTNKLYCTLDNTNIVVHTGVAGDKIAAHGLTIRDIVTVKLKRVHPNGFQVKITSTNGTYTFTSSDNYQAAECSECYPYAVMDATNVANTQISWSTDDLRKPVWICGDSYISEGYWTTYFEYVGNVLLNGHAGGVSSGQWSSLSCLMQIGTPKYVVWCMGMNDGTDSDINTPATNWVTYRDNLLEVCEEKNIIPIFATIPTVPSILHEGKNAWIRNSGYRYIDIAKAVGANADGTWFTGLLSVDNVHPTANGAKVIANTVSAYFAEFCILE